VEIVNVPEPDAPGPADVAVTVEYAPINNTDLLMMRGRYGTLPTLPAGIGSEGVGRVTAIGSQVRGLAIGDRVPVRFGYTAWREQLVLPADGLFALPARVDPRQLAMIAINPPTAVLLLSEFVALAPGDWVIQNAGNSGVGRSVIAAARQRGIKTVSLGRRPELIDELRAAGGDVVLLEGADLPARVAAATGNARMSLALDGVGGDSTLSLSTCLPVRGTLVMYSTVSKKPGLASAVELVFRNITMRGFWLLYPEYSSGPKYTEAVKTSAALFAEGKLHLPVAASYRLDAIKDALAHAQRGGKVVLEIQGSR
jgi:NADPH:quinone reductase-like Zn-dependent oxidoreductase